MANPRRVNHIKKLKRMIEVTNQELTEDFMNDEESSLQKLIVSQQERLIEKMEKNG
jgi:hypothetical protein